MIDPVLGFSLLLGCRHGLDPDHLTAIDGLTQLRPNAWNGVVFALGHGVVVTLLAAGVGAFSVSWLEPIAPWMLLAIGTVSLVRLVRRSHGARRHAIPTSSPLLLGIVFAAGFETASQLSALALVHQGSPWLVGAMFSVGMVVVDGIDGYNAFVVRGKGKTMSAHAERMSIYLGALVVVSSFALAAAEFGNLNIDRYGLVAGVLLFLAVLSLRVWGRLATRERVAG